MRTRLATVAFSAALVTNPVSAEERLELNNIYPLNQQIIQLSESVFFTQDNQGYFEVIDGPLEEGPTRCMGSGFGYQDGTSSIEGICIFGEGADTFTMAWKAGQKGEANTWVIVDGTGKFKGMTGKGIASTGIEMMFKAMPLRKSHIIGTIDIPAN